LRHQKKSKQLSLTKSHPRAVFRNQAVSLILYEKIKTTAAKAKLLRGIVENLITKAKTENLAARRELISYLPKMGAVRKVFEELVPRFKERKGGYTRIHKIGTRKGDGAEIVEIALT
jgi:large subunit ribosomal protein L17